MTDKQQQTTWRLPDGTALPKPARVVTEVRRLASERPKYVYRVSPDINYCTYTDNEHQGACIIGQAFTALGVPEQSLREVDADGMGAICTLYYSDDDVPEVRWLKHVQIGQDGAVAWGDAVDGADQAMYTLHRVLGLRSM